MHALGPKLRDHYAYDRCLGARFDGILCFPSGIRIFGDNLIVADMDGIKVMTLELKTTQIIGKPGSADGEIFKPSDVAVGLTQNIIVSDTGKTPKLSNPPILIFLGNNRIQIFDQHGSFIRKFASLQDPNSFSPQGIDVDHQGNIYVCDGLGHIHVFSQAGLLLRKFPIGGNPTKVSVNNNFCMVSTSTQVQVFDLNGKFLRKIGSRGVDLGCFMFPYGVFIDYNGRTVVTERNLHNIQLYDSEGKFYQKLTDGQHGAPVALTVDKAGNIYVLMHRTGMIKIYKPEPLPDLN